ncbi:MAG: flavodoxin [Firmicutes bacterium]|nr:flavodoxin [Bacillota bacterium]
MKKILLILLTLCMMIGLAACSGSNTSDEAAGTDNEKASTEEQTSEVEGNDSENSTLVVYFSVTGNTRGVAEKIADITGADVYEIKAAEEYTSEDIDYDNSDSRTTHEQNDSSARPEIGSDTISLEGYTTIYIGYPIWWGQEPRIMDTFVESYDFDGITMIPFCTSGSSDIGQSGQNLADNAGSGSWLEGKRFAGGASEDEIRTWIDGLQ